MNADEFIQRALRAADRGAVYELGRGGTDPSSPAPGDSKKRCDCSGFLAWALGLGRKTDHPLYRKLNGGWIETSAIVTDAQTSTGFFAPLGAIKRGAILVYPDYVEQGGKHRSGHCAIVVEAGSDLPSTKIVHCASTNRGSTGAIAVTDGRRFLHPGTLLSRYEGIDDLGDIA